MGYIPTVRFRSDDLNTIINGLDSEQVKSVTFQKFLLNIEQSIKRKKINTVFCYVDDDFEIVINEKDYDNILSVLENYYLGKEDYEICAKIKHLKEDNEKRRS
jgi:hypothetical protein